METVFEPVAQIETRASNRESDVVTTKATRTTGETQTFALSLLAHRWLDQEVAERGGDSAARLP